MSETPTDPTTASTRRQIPDVPDRSRLPTRNLDDAEESVVPDLDRRDYLKAMGAAGAAASLAGASTGSAAAQVGGAWEDDAEDRIEEHRKSDLEVVVENTQGEIVPDADVEIEMQEHDFGFGTAVDANELLAAGDDDPYVEELRDNFNKVVLENHHKWRFMEENQQTADEATQWLVDEGFEIRGHACLWGSRDAYAIPAEIETAIDNRDAETIIEASMDHLEWVIEHYGDDIVEWDVVNEALHAHDLVIGIYDDDIDQDEPWTGDVQPWTAPILADWYERAEEVADQYDVDIAVNDFNTLAAWEYSFDWYPEQIEHILDAGVDLDSIGFQGHVEAATGEPLSNDDPDQRLNHEQLMEVLEIYEEYDADLKVTEFDTFQGGDEWDGDEEKADVLYTWLKTIFAHPQATDFLMWGYWDGNHWGDDYGQGHQPDAPLFYQDWSPKPGYDVWQNLVFEEWWTEESGTTDASGTYSTSAFLGEHEVTVSTDEETTTETISLTDADGTTSVVIEADGEGGNGGDDCPVGEGETLSNGNTVCDIDGDGKYRDLTASGDTTTQDLQYFFENQHREPYDSRTDLFDFTDNGDVGQPDVVDLFHAI